MTDVPLLVIGATGTIGSEVIRGLAGRAPVRVLVRSDASADAVRRVAPGCEVAQGDLSLPSTLTEPFAGIRHVFLLTPSVSDQLQLEENALAAARQAGVERIVYMSNREVVWGIELSRAHQAVEAMLRESGIAHTILRPDYLLDNLLFELDDLAAGRLVAPSTHGRCAFLEARDVALAAVAALLADEPLDGPLVLTGPESLSWTELAQRLSVALGREIEHVDPGAATWRVSAEEGGMTPWLAGALAEYFRRLETESAPSTDDLIRASGEGARSIEDFAKDRLIPALGQMRVVASEGN